MYQKTGLIVRNNVPLIPINYMLTEAHDKIHDLIGPKSDFFT